MGSEMCIRDRVPPDRAGGVGVEVDRLRHSHAAGDGRWRDFHCERCLLYTSDAADERSSVDLGGRRIIKKKIQVR